MKTEARWLDHKYDGVSVAIRSFDDGQLHVDVYVPDSEHVLYNILPHSRAHLRIEVLTGADRKKELAPLE